MRIIFALLFSALSSYALAALSEFTLPNGLKVVVKEDHRAPIVVSMVWYNVGSADEKGGYTGLSHALEHMMFKGTPKYPLGYFSQIIASLGGQENAFTNYDYTAYFEKMAANQLAKSFELEADRMQHLLLQEDEFAKEMKVIREERRMRTDNNPQALAFERYLAAAHLSTPYHHPVIGWMSDLYQMNIKDLKAWYERFYSPDNATVVVVGDVNPKEVHQLAIQYFGPINKKADYQRKPQTEPPGLGQKTLEIKVPAKLPLLMFGYTVPSAKSAKIDYEPYALELLANILSAGESGRFAKGLVRNQHIASDAESYYNLYARFSTQFILFATPAQGHNLDELKKAMQKELTRLQNESVSQQELNRIKTQIIAQKTFEKDSIFGQAMELGLLETIGLGWQAAEQYTDKISAITPEQIQAVAKKYFNDKSLTEAKLIPAQSEKGNE